ncbi:hypothetical protein ACROYT_G000684 [Oculina patagonica]
MIQIFGRKPHNSTTKPSPEYMLRLVYKKVDPGAVKGNLVYAFQDSGGSSDRRFKFNVTSKSQVLRFAELQLYKLPSTLGPNQNSTATVHIIDMYSGKRLSTQHVSIATTGWIRFPIPLNIVRRWYRNPASNAGLDVLITESSLAPLVRFATRQTDPNLQPMVLLHCIDPGSKFQQPMNISSNTKPQKRSPRSVHSQHKGPCQRRKLDISFEDLGWDEWVIAPRKYTAYYCAGTCDTQHYSKIKTNHARIQLFLSQRESYLADPPCCVPDKLGSISMLFYGRPGESDYVLKEMNDFVVESCACL